MIAGLIRWSARNLLLVGFAGVFLGNAGFLSRSIYTADLDVYLLQPKGVLSNFPSRA